MTKIETLRERNRFRLIAGAAEHLHLEGIACATIPLAGTNKVIAIGTPAQVAKLMDIETVKGAGLEGLTRCKLTKDYLGDGEYSYFMDEDPDGDFVAFADVERLLATQAPKAAVAEGMGEEMVRFCPHCASVGDVGPEYRDCCPDGSAARRIPKKLAEVCHDTFKLAISRVAPPAEAASGTLHGFDRDDLEAVADGLDCYEKTVYVGGPPIDECDVNHIPSTTAVAARFIRAALATPPVPTPAAGAELVEVEWFYASLAACKAYDPPSFLDGAKWQAARSSAARDQALTEAEKAVLALAINIKDLPERTGEQEAYNEALEGSIAAIRRLRTVHGKAAQVACSIPPGGWACTRAVGHDGPCAASLAGALRTAPSDAGKGGA